MTEVSICVVSFNTPEPMLTACLTAAAAALEPFDGEVIVIDNASAEVPQLPNVGVPSRLLKRSCNDGFGVAMNLGVASCSGEYVLALNPDAELDRQALTALVLAARQQRGKALFCGWLVVPTGRVQVDAYLLWWWSISRLLIRRRRRVELERHGRNSRDLVAVEKVSGGALFGEREVLLQLGPFDPDFFLYGEDVDLSVRAKEAGFSLYAVPRALVHHKGAYSARAYSALVERARTDAAIRLHIKHRGYFSSVIARLELLVITLLGLVLSRGSSSKDRTGRAARLQELRRWGWHRNVPRFAPEAPTWPKTC